LIEVVKEDLDGRTPLFLPCEAVFSPTKIFRESGPSSVFSP